MAAVTRFEKFTRGCLGAGRKWRKLRPLNRAPG
jgi:hypothetical protein